MDGESQNEKDARVEKLWRSLHAKRGTDELDLDGLRAGLARIDHPLQNAQKMLQAVMRTVDTSGDGRIQYDEFREFVEKTEDELLRMFKSIDRDRNGVLDKQELRLAFDRADIKISDAKLQDFFDRVDRNHDGIITFEEWRDFLLFIPTLTPNLRSVLSFYASTVSVSPEGDASVLDENFEGLGSSTPPYISANSILPDVLYLLFEIKESAYTFPARVMLQPRQQHPQPPPVGPLPSELFASSSERYNFPWDPGEGGDDRATRDGGSGNEVVYPTIREEGNELEVVAEGLSDGRDDDEEEEEEAEFLLTSLLPHPGYFLAGGMAGAVSRTATAPLDRLKVFLIAQTATKADTVQAMRSGAPIQALRAAIKPLSDACIELWRVGGIRSLWAGNGLNVVKVAPESAIKFGSYEGAKRIMARLEGHSDPRDISGVSQFFAAGAGGMISQFAVYPLDTLKFRVQCETVEGGSKGNALIVSTFRRMSAEGWGTFYRGLGMGLVGMFPYAALDLTIYEYMKQWYVARKVERTGCSEDDALPGQMVTGGIGAVSSSLGASAVYPLNLLRTRMQSQGTAIHPPTYDGWRDCLAKTLEQEGARGLYKGLTPNLLKVVPAMSISYIMYESSKKVIGLR